MSRTPKSEPPKPPYISITKMQKLLLLLSSRSFSQLTLNDLVSREFPKPEAFQALQGLKFLSFLGEGGKVQNTQILSLRGEARTNGLQEVLRKAYSKIFEVNPDPAMLSKDELHNEFVAVYNLSPRLVRSAVPLFLWLCNEAGMQVSEEITPRKREKQAGEKKGLHPTKKQSKEPHVSPSDVFEYHNYDFSGIKLFVPKNPEIDLEVAKGSLSEIADKILEFAEKVGLKKTEKLPTENDPGETPRA